MIGGLNGDGDFKNKKKNVARLFQHEFYIVTEFLVIESLFVNLNWTG